MKKLLAASALLAALALAYAWRGGYLYGDGRIIKRTEFLMDTLVSVQVVNDSGRFRAEAALDRAFGRMRALDGKFNCVNPASPVYKFNSERTPITDPEIVELTEKSLALSRDTGGAFDITVQPLVDLWGFYSTSASSHTVPSPAAVKAALARTGWRRVLVKDGAVVPADGDVRLDFGSIAKGYIVGEAVKALKAGGARSALVLAGGQVQVFGSAAPGVPWRVGLRNPRGDGYIASLPFEGDIGIASSGDYERYFEAGGVRYHHILDPKTGYPARGVMSVSVITADPALADGLDTPLFVMGERGALDYARRHPGVEVILVNASGKVVTSGQVPAVN